MSPIGRIFLVLNLILSAVFLGWASNVLSTSQEWRDKYDQKEQELATTQEQLEEEISRINAELSTSQSTAANFREERDQSRTQLQQASAALEEEKGANARLRESVESNTQKLSDYNSRLEALLASKERAEADARKLQGERDAAQSSARDAERAQRDAQDSAQASEQRIAELETELTAARSEIKRLDATLQQIMATTNLSLNDFQAVPQIDATVLDVRNDLGLVALNVGTRDGVERGMTFSVFHGTNYKGKVRIENVEEYQSSAIVSNPSQSVAIAQGDQASTQL